MTAADDLACAAAVLAAEADRARRHAGLWRGAEHRLWAERADRLERALAEVVRLQKQEQRPTP